jgi:hypothetical protein
MKLFSSAFTLERNLTTDVNLRTGALNVSINLATIPASWDPHFDYPLIMQFQPGGGFSNLEWLLNIPRMDLKRRQLTTIRGEVYRMTGDTCNCKIEYPKLENINIRKIRARVGGGSYEVWRDDLSYECYNDFGSILWVVTPPGHRLNFSFFPYDPTIEGSLGAHPKLITNNNGDRISFSRKFETDQLNYVEIKRTYDFQKTTERSSIVRVELRKEGGREWIASVSLPDRFTEKFTFEYEYPANKARRLTKVTTPTGLVKKITYTELPINDSGAKMDAVQKMEISDLGDPQAPVRTFEYSYSQNNYLGYRPGAPAVEDKDAMFEILDDNYKYWIVEAEHIGGGRTLNTRRTYNRFHLLEKEEKYSSADAPSFIAETWDYRYPIKAGLALASQDSQFTLATETTYTVRDAEELRSSIWEQSYNAAGNFLTRTSPYGVKETFTYSAILIADPSRIFQPLISYVIMPPDDSPLSGKKIGIAYSQYSPQTAKKCMLPTTAFHYLRDRNGIENLQFQRRFIYLQTTQWIPAFYEGAIQSIRSFITGQTGARQEFKWETSSTDNARMLRYTYGVSIPLAYGGRVAYDPMRRPVITYDALNRKTISVYDMMGQLTQQTIYADTAKAQVSSYEFKRWQSGGNNEVIIKSPGQPEQRQRFNAYGHHISIEILVPSGSQAGWQAVRKIKYDQRQLPVEIRERDFYTMPGASAAVWHESVVQNTYDDHKRLATILQADGTHDTFTYNRITATQERYRNSSPNPSERWGYAKDGKIMFYDQISPDTPNSPVNSRISFAYDDLRRLLRVFHSYPKEKADVGPFAVTEYRYDYHDRITQELNYVAQSRATPEVTDPCERVTYTYDPALRPWNMELVTRLAVDSNKADTDFLLATRTYDTAGRMLTEDTRGGRKLTYSYARVGEQRPSKVLDASNAGYEQYFDAVTGMATGRKLLSTQQQYVFARDSLNRLTEVRLKNSQGGTDDLVEFTYDDLGRQVGEVSNGEVAQKTLSIGGRLLSATPGGVTCFYDASGRLAKKTYAKPDASVSHSMEIDVQYSAGMMSRLSLNDAAAGMVARIDFTHIDGRETERVYTVANQERLKISSTYSDPTTLQKRSYLISPLSTTLEESFSFDTQDRLSSIAYKKTVGATVSNATTNFTFDEHARIKTLSGNNLAGAVNDSYDYKWFSDTGAPDMLNAITRAGSALPIGYRRGSMSNATGAASLQYSDQNNLLSASNPSATDPNDLKVQCTYDALNRFSRSVVTQTRPTAMSDDVSYRFIDRSITGEDARAVPHSDATWERTAFFRANGVLLGRFVMRPEPPTAAASFAEIFATDHNGSVMGVFGYQGATVLRSAYYSYDAYGQRTELGATSSQKTGGDSQ